MELTDTFFCRKLNETIIYYKYLYCSLLTLNSTYNSHMKYTNELTTKSKFLYYLPAVAKSWKRKYIFGNVEESELRWFSWNSHFMR